jgi:lysosomal alpha-mannosidase
MYSHYYWPAGFENDQRDSNDDPVVIDKTLSSFNGDKMVDTMLHYVEDMRQAYRTNHLLVPMGGDFSFMNSQMNFKSMDNLIEYFNSKVSNTTLIYSTPSEYLDAITALNISWPTNYDDMFPYADNS